MFSDFLIVDEAGHPCEKWERLTLGDTGGRNEAWLRDTVLSNPQILPIKDIDPDFGPLVPLCSELRTEAGPVDACFINHSGKLTIVECKLWRNPQARREVVAQTLDYARALQRWSYSDLQRLVSQRLGEPGNVPFQRVRAIQPDLDEAEFVDAAARALRAGRMMMIILGDGIREDVESIAELVNRNAASAFQLSVVEAALYGVGGQRVAVQTRVLARTRLIERSVVLVKDGPGAELEITDQADPVPTSTATPNLRSDTFRSWWEPVLAMSFDDPDQPAPVYVKNFVRSSLPWPRLAIGAYWTVSNEDTSVYLLGPKDVKTAFFDSLGEEATVLLDEIPGAEFLRDESGQIISLTINAQRGDFPSAEAHRAWLIENMNRFANALRPPMKRLLATRNG